MTKFNTAIHKRLRRYDDIVQRMEDERVSFISHWRDLAKFIVPRRPRFFVSDANKGDRRNYEIVDSTATLSFRNARSGMMSGLTSPARPWFRLTTTTPGLSESESVRVWLDVVTEEMRGVFLRSNLYNVLPIIYGDLIVFGTAAMHVDEDEDDVIRMYSYPIGSYACSNNNRLVVDTFTREFRMTVRQIVEEYGQDRVPGAEINWDNISTHVQDLYMEGQFEEWIDIRYLVMPNSDFDPESDLSKHKRYKSVHYEKGYANSHTYEIVEDKLLREKGYDYFPVLAPRWEITGEDVYGNSCPGMVALGDIKQLQLGERRTMQAVEKMVHPPLTAPSLMRNKTISGLPGSITYTDMRGDQEGIRPLHEVTPRIQEMEIKQDQCRQRIRRAFYEDLFLMMASSDRREITAREIEERHEEKMLALGPVLEQLNQDLLDPLISITFDKMVKQGRIPEPPPELQGANLKVEYVSTMAQAQKMLGLSSLERFTQYVGGLLQMNPEIADKVDFDQLVDEYGDAISLPPSVVKDDEMVMQIREQRAQQMAQQQQMEAMQAMAGAAKDLGSANTQEGSALGALMSEGQAEGEES